MNKLNDPEKDILHVKLSEIYLARRVSLELMRDCDAHSCARVNNAFMSEVVSLLSENSISVGEEVGRLNDADKINCANALKAFDSHRQSQP